MRSEGGNDVYQHPHTDDGSELAGKAVEHGIVLAKRIGAKTTVLTVLLPFHIFTTDAQMLDDTPAQYKARMQAHAEKTLGAVAQAAQTSGGGAQGRGDAPDGDALSGTSGRTGGDRGAG